MHKIRKIPNFRPNQFQSMDLKTWLLAFCIIFTCQPSIAQKNYVPGYIITSNGDRVNGFILDKGWDQNPKVIQFRTSLSETAIEYSAAQIKEFKIDGGANFFGFIVDVDKSPYKVGQMDKYLAGKSVVRDTVFLEILDKGKYSLFRIRDESDKYHYYYALRNSIPKELIVKVDFSDASGISTMTTTPIYKSQLKSLMADCSQVLPAITNLKYVQREMIKLFNSYNKCVGESVAMDAQAKTEFEWFVAAGLSQTQLKFNGQSGISFEASTDPTFAIGLNTIFPRNNKVWSVYSEIQYKSYKTKSNGNTYIFDLGYVRASAAYRYTFINSNVRPYFQAGVLVGHGFKFESNRDFDRLDPGAFVSAGIRKNKLGGEFRLERTTGMFPSFPFESAVTSYYFLLSYKIN